MNAEDAEEVETAVEALESIGYVVLKAKSYRQAQERQRVAEAYKLAAIDEAKRAREWALDCLAEERRLRERLTFVYGVARAKGATDEELRGPTAVEVEPPATETLAEAIVAEIERRGGADR